MPHDGPEHGPDHSHAHGDDHSRDQGDGREPGQVCDWAAPAQLLQRGAGSGCLLYVDAFCGAAGDMLLAALLDLGVPQAALEQGLGDLALQGYRLSVTGRRRSGIAAAHVDVVVDGTPPSRTHADIVKMIDGAALPEGARVLALRAFRILAEAEAEIHDMPIEQVHFHEVGAVDSIVDIVAVALALDHLGAEVVASPLPLGHGMIRAQHGRLPVPAPATVLCLKGVPTYDGGIEAELVTPTGACLLAAAASRFDRWPPMRPVATGWGAGSKDFAERPNLLRVVLGRAQRPALAQGEVVVLETNLDDSTAEINAHALQRAFDAGALDAWWTSIGMKKGRAGVLLSVLARPADADALARLLLSETGALGVRRRTMARWERARAIHTVATDFGEIRVKLASGDGLPSHVAPELEDCRSAAMLHNVPLKDVYAAAASAALSLVGDERKT